MSTLIDVSKFKRRKPDMTIPKDLRTEDEKVIDNVKGMVTDKIPDWEGSVCVDNLGKGNWKEMTFHEKTLALFDDTMYKIKRG